MDIVDRIYEAAVFPERWVDVFDGMCAASGSSSGSILIHSPKTGMTGLVSPVLRATFAEAAQRNEWQSSPRFVESLVRPLSNFTRLNSLVPPEQVDSDPVWQRLAAQGIGDQVAISNDLPSGERLGFTAERLASAGPYRARDIAALDRLRPHLNRAGQVAARLALQRAEATVETLDQIGLAAAVIDRRSRVIVANSLLEALPETLVPTAFGGIAIADRVADGRFRAALARVGTEAAESVVSLPIRGTAATPPLLVHLLPVCGDARDIFTGGRVLLVAVKVERRAAPQADLLNGLFDLTPAEARLVRELVRGGALPEIAARLGLSVHTVRAQLRSVVGKTGVHRQTELVQLLAAL